MSPGLILFLSFAKLRYFEYVPGPYFNNSILTAELISTKPFVMINIIYQ